jgi:hypothetical protein
MNIRKYLLITAVALSPLLMANQGCEQTAADTSRKEQFNQESNQKVLLNVQPPPRVSVSAERKNLIERLRRLNSENMSGCVYLISHGTVMAFYPVKGKVSSLNSYLTGKDKVIDDPYGSMEAGGVVVEQPDYDGSYGKNAEGVFFFTADTNTYVEWAGEYLYSDSCLTLSVRPTLVRTIK